MPLCQANTRRQIMSTEWGTRVHRMGDTSRISFSTGSILPHESAELRKSCEFAMEDEAKNPETVLVSAPARPLWS